MNQAIHQAVDAGDLNLLWNLVIAGEHSPDVLDDNGDAPIHRAIRKGDSVMFVGLFNVNANLDARDRRGWNALHLAAELGRWEMIHLLVAWGLPVDVRTQDEREATALHIAAESGNEWCIRELAAKGASLDARLTSGETPLALAFRAKKASAARKLGALRV